MKQLTNILILVLLLCFHESTLAQIIKQKDYERSFLAKPGGRIDLNNKYGEIIVRSWKVDSVSVAVRVIADGRSSDIINKSLNKIGISFRQVGEIITVETQVDKSSGFFGNLLSEVDDYSKSLFGGAKVTVNYEVLIPENFDLNVENKYGNVFLAQLSGRVSVELAHGDLKANGLEKDFNLKHSFGKSRIDQLYRGTFHLKGAELKIDKGHIVNLESSSSEITLGIIDFAQFNSRNDKISIRQIDEVIAEGIFTDLSADMILSGARLDFDYGDIFITRVQRDFKSIDIIGKSTDISLILDQGSYISADITAKKDRLIVPSSMLVLKKEGVDDESEISLSGYVGPTQKKNGELSILADGGEVIISIQELPLFTNKN